MSIAPLHWPGMPRRSSASVARFCSQNWLCQFSRAGRLSGPGALEMWPYCLRLSGFERVNCRPTRAHHEPLRRTPLSSTTALSRRIHSAHDRRVLLNLTVVPVLGLVLAFSACGSSSSNSSDTPRSSHTTSSKDSKTKADCSSHAILSALPGGATMQEFTCAKVDDTEWAAARVSPGDTVFFLRWNGTKWNAEDSDSVCGTASAGLPQSLLSYCKAGPSSSTSPATAACTSEAILAALPAGAEMQRFTCADVSGKLWAAARVSPGDTVFFLQWNGTKWNAEDSDSVCGTASAGLPSRSCPTAKRARPRQRRRPPPLARPRRFLPRSRPAPDAGVHLRRRQWQAVGRCAC